MTKRLDVEDSVSLICRHLCANDFEGEIICQPIVRWQSIISLFASGAVKHCKSKLQEMLCRVKIGGSQRYAHRTILRSFFRRGSFRQDDFPADSGPVSGFGL
jgi:hypothetical protein